MTGHTFEHKVYAHNADDMEVAARAAVEAYFGPDLTGVEWSVETDRTVQRLTGAIVHYVGRVSARRG